MKRTLLILLPLLLGVIIYLRAQETPNLRTSDLVERSEVEIPIVDTPPPPQYQYFLKATIDINQWDRAKDTIVAVMGSYGKSFSVDQSELYRALLYRQIEKINFTVDSVLIPKTKK